MAGIRHSVCVLEADGAVVERFDVAHDAAGLREVVRHRVGQVGIERGDGPVVDTPAWRSSVISSRQVRALRLRYGTAGNKDDRFDAFVLADVLRTDAHRLRPLIPDTAATVVLAIRRLRSPRLSVLRVSRRRSRRLIAEIRDRGHGWNRKKIARLMTLAGIEGIHRRRHGKERSRLAAGAVPPDLGKRKFAAARPDGLWVADIPYLRTWQGVLYLAVVIDACAPGRGLGDGRSPAPRAGSRRRRDGVAAAKPAAG